MYRALCDYEIATIHCFAEIINVTPIALLSEALVHNTDLLFSPDFVKEVRSTLREQDHECKSPIEIKGAL